MNIPKLAYHVGTTLLNPSLAKSELKFVLTTAKMFDSVSNSRTASIAKELWNQKFIHFVGSLSFANSAVELTKDLYFQEYYKDQYQHQPTQELQVWRLANEVVNLINSSVDVFFFAKHFTGADNPRLGSAFEFIEGASSIAASVFAWSATDNLWCDDKVKGVQNPLHHQNSSWYINKIKNGLGIAAGVLVTVKWLKDIKSTGFERLTNIVSIVSVVFAFISSIDISYKTDTKPW